jgi:hypothetical protein
MPYNKRVAADGRKLFVVMQRLLAAAEHDRYAYKDKYVKVNYF